MFYFLIQEGVVILLLKKILLDIHFFAILNFFFLQLFDICF